MLRFMLPFESISEIYYALSGNVFEEAEKNEAWVGLRRAHRETERKVGNGFPRNGGALFTLKSRNCNKFVCLTQ